MHLNYEIGKMSINEGEGTCWEWENGQNIYVVFMIVCPYPGRYPCILSYLKPLDRPKPNFVRSPLAEGE